MGKIIAQQEPGENITGKPENKRGKAKAPAAPEKGQNIIPLPLNIFLIGFMGSGKSHWGKIWAPKNKLDFYDLDTRIEGAFNMSITEIFEKKGEEKFREMELYHLKRFEFEKNYLLACGGGTPCFADNLQWMKTQGMVIYLKASPQSILNHVMHETEQRPIIKEVNTSELLFFIQKKLAEREPFYSQADITLSVESLDENSLYELLHPVR